MEVLLYHIVLIHDGSAGLCCHSCRIGVVSYMLIDGALKESVMKYTPDNYMLEEECSQY